MNALRKLFFAFLVTAAVSLGFLSDATAQAVASPDYVHAPDMRRLLHWTHFPILVYFTPGALTTKERKDSTLAGFDEWVHATRNFAKYQVVTTEAQANVTVTFLPESTVPGKDGATGNTRITFLESAVIKHVRMVLATANISPLDLQATACHEFGHALGIDGHSDDPDDIMYPILTCMLGEIDFPAPVHAITQRDLHTLKACYPALGLSSSPPVSSAESSQ